MKKIFINFILITFSFFILISWKSFLYQDSIICSLPIPLSNNMYKLQDMLEIYYSKNYEKYPKNIKTLELDAKKKNYWINVKNEYDKTDNVFVDYKNLIIKTNENDFYFSDVKAGQIIYKPEKNYQDYYIFIAEKKYKENFSDILVNSSFELVNWGYRLLGFEIINFNYKKHDQINPSGFNSWIIKSSDDKLKSLKRKIFLKH